MFSPENLDFQRRKLPAQAWLDDHHSVMFWSCFDQVFWSYLGNWGEGCGHLLLKLGGDYLQDKIQNDATDIIFDADFCFTWLCCFLTFKYGNALCSCPWNQLTGYLLLTSQSHCAMCNCCIAIVGIVETFIATICSCVGARKPVSYIYKGLLTL